jgi:hypothetical protein
MTDGLKPTPPPAPPPAWMDERALVIAREFFPYYGQAQRLAQLQCAIVAAMQDAAAAPPAQPVAQPGQHTHADPRLETAQQRTDARFSSALPAQPPFGCGYPYCGGNGPECKTCNGNRYGPAA